MRLILHTRPDGGVTYTMPSPDAMRALTQGGFPLWTVGTCYEQEMAKVEEQGLPVAIWSRWYRAYERGGLTDAEAYALIRDKDVPACDSAAELIDWSDLPDQWFRDAWRRGHNGGPISIDLEAARNVQLDHIAAALSLANVNWWRDRDEPRSVDWPALRRAVRRAACPDAVREIWPAGLARHTSSMPASSDTVN